MYPGFAFIGKSKLVLEYYEAGLGVIQHFLQLEGSDVSAFCNYIGGIKKKNGRFVTAKKIVSGFDCFC